MTLPEEGAASGERPLIDRALEQVRAAMARSSASRRGAAPTLMDPADLADLRPGAEWPPGYRVRERLHRGGQGVVFRATRLATGQDVALKVVLDGGPGARFDREARVLAKLRHPGVVTIQDRGESGGRAWYAMEWIPGHDLDRHLEAARPGVSARVELCATIAEAVAAAHGMGVIHRDLKPANIRVDEEGVPRVLDFGLAREAADSADPADAGRTRTGAFVGTAAWASPEQVRGDPDRISLATDVYALGAVFHLVLTGRPPYELDGPLHATFDRILHAEPSRPSRVAPGLDRDLDAIVLRCLEKEPTRRYASAAELAADLRRHQLGLPIDASRAHAGYVVRKLVARHRVAAAVAAAFAALIALSIAHLVTSRAQIRRTASRLDAALTARDLAEIAAAYERGERDRMVAALDRLGRGEGEPIAGFFRELLALEGPPLSLDRGARILAATFLEGDDVAVGAWSGEVAVLTRDGATRSAWTGLLTDVRDLAYEPERDLLVAAGSDGVTWIDPRDGAIVAQVPVTTGGLERLSVSRSVAVAATRDGRIFALPHPDARDPGATRDSTTARDPEGPRDPSAAPGLATPPDMSAPAAPRLVCRHPSVDGDGHAGVSGVAATAVDARDRRVATAGRGSVRLWSIDQPDPLLEVPLTRVAFGPDAQVRELALSPGGDRVALGISDGARGGRAIVLDAANGAPLAEFVGRGGAITSVAFLDDTTLLVGDDDGAVRVCGLGTGGERDGGSRRTGDPATSEPAELGHLLPSNGPARRIVTRGPATHLETDDAAPAMLLISEGPRLAAARMFDVAPRDARPDGAGGASGTDAQRRDVTERDPADPDVASLQPAPDAVARSADGRWIAAATREGSLQIVDTRDPARGVRRVVPPVRCLAFLEPPHLLAIGAGTGELIVVDARHGDLVLTLSTDLGAIVDLGFDPGAGTLTAEGGKGWVRSFRSRRAGDDREP